jgi:hypothetical protein
MRATKSDEVRSPLSFWERAGVRAFPHGFSPIQG